MPDCGTKFTGRVPEESDVILQGWRVLSDAHLAHFPPEEDDYDDDFGPSSFKIMSMDHEIDF